VCGVSAAAVVAMAGVGLAAAAAVKAGENGGTPYRAGAGRGRECSWVVI
jgi:hypothetical protein